MSAETLINTDCMLHVCIQKDGKVRRATVPEREGKKERRMMKEEGRGGVP